MKMNGRDKTFSARSRPRRSIAWVSIAWVLCLALTLLARQTPVAAALGGDETSVQEDRVHMHAALLRMTRSERYTVHEIQASSGTMVREYVSTTGKVFGVGWNG